MTTRRFYPFAPDKPLPKRIEFQPTHVMRVPPPKVGAKDQYIPRVMELHITDNRVLAALLNAGWTLVEDRTVTK